MQINSPLYITKTELRILMHCNIYREFLHFVFKVSHCIRTKTNMEVLLTRSLCRGHGNVKDYTRGNVQDYSLSYVYTVMYISQLPDR